MKVVLKDKKPTGMLNQAPIGFWDYTEEPSVIQSHDDDICHDVKYDHTKKKSGTYKLYLKPFSNGTPEEWLRFKNKIKIVTDGNGLQKDGPALFNVTRSSLQGEALRVFNDAAAQLKETTKDTHLKCLRAVTEHVFPDSALSTQKRYMRHNVYLHLSDKSISEFCARWIEIDNYLPEFPPFGTNQRFPEDETKSSCDSRT